MNENNYECRTSCPYDYPYYPSSKNKKIILLAQKLFLALILNIFIMENVKLHAKVFLAQQFKEDFGFSGCNRTDGYTYTKKLKTEMLLSEKNIVIMMNILLEVYVMIIVQEEIVTLEIIAIVL